METMIAKQLKEKYLQLSFLTAITQAASGFLNIAVMPLSLPLPPALYNQEQLGHKSLVVAEGGVIEGDADPPRTAKNKG